MGRSIVQDAPKYQPTPEAAFQVENTEASKAMSSAESDLIKYVEAQITKMDQKLLFDGSSTPSLARINRALMEHEHVLLALTALYEQNRWTLDAAKKAYNEWHASAFLTVRKEVNDPALSASKWYTKDEIEYMVTCKYKKEQAQLQAAIALEDSKHSLLRRLIDQWNTYHFTLTQLSKNGIAEHNTSDGTSYEDTGDMASEALK